VVSSACLLIVLGGSAFAADSLTGAGASSSEQIYVCVQKKGKAKGQMRLVTARTKCKRTERKTQWAVRGPAGPAGVPGAPAPASTSESGALVSGAVAYYALSQCPAGWSPYEPARGRYVVGLPSGGTAEGTVGTALGAGEDRAVGQHNHGVDDPGHRHQLIRVSPILVGGNVVPTRVMGTTSSSQLTTLPETPGNEPMSTGPTGITLGPAGGVPGTNAPYVQLLACKKD